MSSGVCIHTAIAKAIILRDKMNEKCWSLFGTKGMATFKQWPLNLADSVMISFWRTLWSKHCNAHPHSALLSRNPATARGPLSWCRTCVSVSTEEFLHVCKQRGSSPSDGQGRGDGGRGTQRSEFLTGAR